MSDGDVEMRLSGELTDAPRGAVATVLLAVSGITFVRAAARITGRVALAYRHPAQVRLSDRGLEVSHRTELLGRVLGETETLVPLSNLSSITREVRYARLGLYAGLLALVLGTYVGTGLLVDGARVPGGSPSMLGLGLAIVSMGIVLDFALSTLVDRAGGTCRGVITPHHGRRVCIRGLDPAVADRVLSKLAESIGALRAPEPSPASP
jgi:hypothetical protein